MAAPTGVLEQVNKEIQNLIEENQRLRSISPWIFIIESLIKKNKKAWIFIIESLIKKNKKDWKRQEYDNGWINKDSNLELNYSTVYYHARIKNGDVSIALNDWEYDLLRNALN